MTDSDLRGLANFAYEMGLLKRAKRTGWWVAGIDSPESIAEHSFRVAIIGSLLALADGADPGRTTMMCLFHDTQESRIGDVPYVGRPYVSTASNEDVTADQAAAFPAAVRAALGDLVAEYEGRTSREAAIARDADKLECLIQAREYLEGGNTNAQAWVDSSLAAIQTPVGKEFAEACLQVPPSEWWRAFANGPGVPASADADDR